MKTIAIAFALAVLPLLDRAEAGMSTGTDVTLSPASDVARSVNASARRKVHRTQRVYRGYRSSHGYDRAFGYGYYRGVRPGWGYGPDPGDYAWPPFHFKPYW